jgi:integrase
MMEMAEIRGLRWEDYRDGQLHVTRSMWRTLINDPKTRASKAPIPIIPKLAAMLAPMRKTSGPMFAGKKGKPLQLDNLYRRTMKDILEASKIPWYGWHAFRRGLATLLNERGTDVKTVQGIMRHREPAVTLDHYIQTSEKLQRDALGKINELCTPCAPERVN